eukprot:SAG11_NODE_145_length_14811_cov_24.558931_7_plen_349_part_00
MRAKASNAGLKCDFCVSTGGTQSSGVAAGGKTSVLQVSKKTSGHEASYGNQCDTSSSTGMHACTVVNIPLCLPCAVLSAPRCYFALLFRSCCSFSFPLLSCSASCLPCPCRAPLSVSVCSLASLCCSYLALPAAAVACLCPALLLPFLSLRVYVLCLYLCALPPAVLSLLLLLSALCLLLLCLCCSPLSFSPLSSPPVSTAYRALMRAPLSLSAALALLPMPSVFSTFPAYLLCASSLVLCSLCAVLCVVPPLAACCCIPARLPLCVLSCLLLSIPVFFLALPSPLVLLSLRDPLLLARFISVPALSLLLSSSLVSASGVCPLCVCCLGLILYFCLSVCLVCALSLSW